MYKMKAKKVYEFKRTRNQSLSGKTKIGLTVLEKQEIEKWLDKNSVLNINYEIKDNGQILIYGDLYLLNNTDITDIPNNLNISGNLVINNCPNLTTLPDKIKCEGLEIEKVPITKFPKTILTYYENKNNYFFEGYINIVNTNIKELPDNLEVYKWLGLQENKYLKKFPKNLVLYNDLQISYSEFTELPSSIFYESTINANPYLIFDHSIYMDNSKITKLPDNLYIRGNLDIKNTKIKRPKNLVVGKTIYGKFIDE